MSIVAMDALKIRSARDALAAGAVVAVIGAPPVTSLASAVRDRPGSCTIREMQAPALHAPAARDRMRDRLVAWCAIGSGSDDPAGLEAMLAALAAEFGRLPGTLTRPPCGPGTAAL